MASTMPRGRRETRILSIKSLKPPSGREDDVGLWVETYGKDLPEFEHVLEAAGLLRTSAIPVAFPTETVYGLGADATRSPAVLGIYEAKRRPADNPLIVHVSSIAQLRRLLQAPLQDHAGVPQPQVEPDCDPIPSIYAPLISRFWPGPLTILLANPTHSPLAPEVTAGLPTFGCRIPSSPLARLLIHVTDRPLAAPSANASTRPSPTTAQHVFDDLNGRIELILDGGHCNVGVESTVVDGLSHPPAVLRPGGIGIEEIRSCGGAWQQVVKGYRDKAEDSSEGQQTQQEVNNPQRNGDGVNGTEESRREQEHSGPRAPGMKYKHYSPRARVILFEARTTSQEDAKNIALEHYDALTSSTMNGPSNGSSDASSMPTIGVIRTRKWTASLPSSLPFPCLDVSLGTDATSIARGLFSSLRDLDEKGVKIILIEGIDDADGKDDLAAAIMNRLRKASEVDIK